MAEGITPIPSTTSPLLNTEEPLSLLSNDDPGYETVGGSKASRAARKVSMTETSSDHDPNYETLLPNATVVVAPSSSTVVQPNKPRPQSRRFGDDEEDDGYSKIKPGPTQLPAQGKKIPSSVTDNEGYSSIRNIPQEISIDDEGEEEPGYSKIGATKTNPVKATLNDGYASIDETKKDQLEGYSTIAPPVVMTTSTTSNTNSSVSPVSPIAYFPVATGAETSSYSSNTSPSSEFSSSEVNLNRNSGVLLTEEVGHNYESLTSDDPNYETVVQHLRITENPYEVLENELGTPGAGLALTTDGVVVVSRSTVEVVQERVTTGGEGKVSPSDSPEVGDYFQV